MVKLLNKREDDWTQEQRRLQKLKIEEKMEMAKKQSQYVNKLLSQCKSWCGPIASIAELESVLKKHHDKAETVVKTELAYYKHTHRPEVVVNPSLFKLIRVTHEERLSNLMVLLNQQTLEVYTAHSPYTSLGWCLYLSWKSAHDVYFQPKYRHFFPIPPRSLVFRRTVMLLKFFGKISNRSTSILHCWKMDRHVSHCGMSLVNWSGTMCGVSERCSYLLWKPIFKGNKPPIEPRRWWLNFLKILIFKEDRTLFLRHLYHYICYTRYIGYCTKVVSRDLFEVEHLQRCVKDSNLNWKYPPKPDIQCVAPEHILECSVEGEWNILNNRNSEFTLGNHMLIQNKFNELWSMFNCSVKKPQVICAVSVIFSAFEPYFLSKYDSQTPYMALIFLYMANLSTNLH